MAYRFPFRSKVLLLGIAAGALAVLLFLPGVFLRKGTIRKRTPSAPALSGGSSERDRLDGLIDMHFEVVPPPQEILSDFGDLTDEGSADMPPPAQTEGRPGSSRVAGIVQDVARSLAGADYAGARKRCEAALLDLTEGQTAEAISLLGSAIRTFVEPASGSPEEVSLLAYRAWADQSLPDDLQDLARLAAGRYYYDQKKYAKASGELEELAGTAATTKVAALAILLDAVCVSQLRGNRAALERARAVCERFPEERLACARARLMVARFLLLEGEASSARRELEKVAEGGTDLAAEARRLRQRLSRAGAP